MKTYLIHFVFSALLAIPMVSLAGDDSSSMQTRYGTLNVDDSNSLTFNGKVVKPEIVGNNGLTFVEIFREEKSDVVLVRDDGGDACPAMYYFATIGSDGIRVSDRFGSCSDLAKSTVSGKKIYVAMPDFTGEASAKSAVSKHVCRYKYENGEVNQLPPLNGRQPCIGD